MLFFIGLWKQTFLFNHFIFKVLNTYQFFKHDARTHSESIQRPKMELFAKVINCRKPLTIFTKSSILYVWQDSECSSLTEIWHKFLKYPKGIANNKIVIQRNFSLERKKIAWKVSVFGVFLVRFFLNSNWIWGDTPNTDTFYAFKATYCVKVNWELCL